MILTRTLLCIVLYVYTAQTASITPNYKSSCTLLSNRIYCYSGGYAALGDIVVKRALDEHHYLDLTQTLHLDETSAKWVSVPDDSHFTNEPALAGTASAISDSAFILDGGYNETPNVKNVTRLYDSETNTWTAISNENRTNHDVYMGTAVEVPSKHSIYYWGGLSGQYPGYPVNTTTVLTIRSPKFLWSVLSSSLPLGSFTRFGHTATLDIDGINIYYIGGRIRTLVSTTDDIPTNDNSTLVPYNIIPMTKILTFNTVDSTWTSRQSPSAPTMSNRYMHTANLLPYSGKILIYGGATDDGNEKHPTAVSDYLYLFDPKTLEYTRMIEYEAVNGAGPRFGHSAILCNNTLFVLFGVNQKGLITNEVFFLSLSGSATWLKTYSAFSTNTTATPSLEERKGLSKPAIIGISVAFVLIVLLGIIGFVFGLHSWRKSKKAKAAALLKQQQDEKTMAINNEQYFPQLHKERVIYNVPNEYELYNNNDSATLHDNHTPPRGFSFDVIHKPNQVKDQQPLTFIENQQQQRSTSSFFLQPVTPNTSTVTSNTNLPFVKPSSL